MSIIKSSVHGVVQTFDCIHLFGWCCSSFFEKNTLRKVHSNSIRSDLREVFSWRVFLTIMQSYFSRVRVSRSKWEITNAFQFGFISYVVCICSCFFFIHVDSILKQKLVQNYVTTKITWVCTICLVGFVLAGEKILGRMERTVEQHKKLCVESVSYGHLQPQWLLALSSLNNINILLKYIHTKCVMCLATGNFQLICPCSNFMELNQLPAE